jgi:hypothetical protein
MATARPLGAGQSKEADQMHEKTTPTRWAAIVPSHGFAYYLEEGALCQAPLYSDGHAEIPAPDAPDPSRYGGAIDWNHGFESPGEAEPVRQLARTLACLPEDATASGSDPVLLSRSDLAELLAAIGSARVRAADAYYAEARTWRQAGEQEAADEQEYAGRRMRLSGEALQRASGAISATASPLSDLAELMPKVRWREVDGPQP